MALTAMLWLFCSLVWLGATSSKAIPPLLPCTQPSSPSCQHNCCSPSGTSASGSCAITNKAHVCTCKAPFVATSDSRSCVCPDTCPKGAIQDSACQCHCPIGDTCIGAKCLRLPGADLFVWQDVFSASDCPGCFCKRYDCRANVTGAATDRFGDCSCEHEDHCESASNQCRSSVLPFGRSLRYFEPECKDCLCSVPEHTCTPNISTSPIMAPGQVWVGSLKCSNEAIMLSNLKSPSSHTIEADVSSSYLHRSSYRLAQWRIRGFVGHNCSSLLSVPGPNGEVLLSNTGPQTYLPVDFMGSVAYSSAETTFVFKGTVPKCRDQQFSLRLAAPCKPTEYRNPLGICSLATVCLPGQRIFKDATVVADRVCQPCLPGTYSSTNNAATCQQQVSCQPGSSISDSGSVSSARKCAPCTLNVTYQDRPQQTSCKTVSACGAGVGEFQAPSLVSDRICTNCDGDATYASQLNQASCSNTTVCSPGSFVAQQATITSDRICKPCPADTFSDSFNQPSCDPLHMCQPGTYVTVNATAVANRRCQQCRNNTYTTTVNAIQCMSAKDCQPGQGTLQAPTTTRDRRCVACLLGLTFSTSWRPETTCSNVSKTCLPGYQSVAEATLTSNRVCKSCPPGSFQPEEGLAMCRNHTQCLPGYVVTLLGNTTHDTVCSPCPVGYYKSEMGDVPCLPHHVCTDSQWQQAPPSITSDTLCVNTTICNSTQWEVSSPTTTTDRQCAECTVCPSRSHLEVARCTPDSDTICAGCHTCGVEEYLLTPCTDADAGTCGNCTQCNSTEFEIIPCAPGHDRSCAPISQCNFSHDYQVAAATQSSDTRCKHATECLVTEFVVTMATNTSDRVCQALSPPCILGQYEVVQPTSTSDRECRQCTDGAVDDDGNPITPCVPCPRGSYVPSGETGSCADFACPSGYADLDGNVSTPCELCPDGTFAAGRGQAQCQPWSLCPPGFQAVNDSGSAQTDRLCTPCAEKHYSSTNTTVEACQPWQNCDPGTFMTTLPSATADRTCQPCGNTTFSADTNVLLCTNHTICQPGFYETTPGTSSSNAQCRLCPAETFQPESGGTSCQAWTLCDLGYEQDTVPTRVRDATCRLCVLGATFRSNLTQAACEHATQCAPGFTELKSATTTTDRVCEACRLGEGFKATQGSLPCDPVQTCPIGQREVAVPTLSSDRQCEACPVGTFKPTEGQSPCLSISAPCNNSIEYEAQAPTSSSDRLCEVQSQCGAHQFEAAAPTMSTDRECLNCTVTCPFNHKKVGECSRFADTDCLGCEACPAEHYASQPCTPSTNVSCTECATCDLRVEYVAIECSLSTDRTCLPLSNCSADEFISRPASLYADLQCSNATLCQSYEYEHLPLTMTSDRVCLPIRSPCQPGEYQVAAPTTTSNRVCQPCPAGSLSNETGASSCTLCFDGVYVPAGSAGSCHAYRCVPGTSDHDGRSDTPCQPCANGTHYQPDFGQDGCLLARVCGSGSQAVETSYSVTSDRACEQCPAGTFRASSAALDAPCESHTPCGPGFGVVSPPTAAADARCAACVPSMFKPAVGYVTCDNVTRCQAGEYQVTAPTPTSDAFCLACEANTFKSFAGPDACQPVTTCKFDQYIESYSTLTSDTRCVDLTVCTRQEYEAQASTATSNRVCRSAKDLITVLMYIPVEFKNFVTPLAQYQFATVVETVLRAPPLSIQGFMDTIVDEVDMQDMQSVLASVRVGYQEGATSIQSALVNESIVLNLEYANGTTTSVVARWYNEKAAHAAALEAFVRALDNGESETTARVMAEAAYQESGGLDSFNTVWTEFSVTHGKEPQGPPVAVTLATMVVGVLLACMLTIIAWRDSQSLTLGSERSDNTRAYRLGNLLTGGPSGTPAPLGSDTERYELQGMSSQVPQAWEDSRVVEERRFEQRQGSYLDFQEIPSPF
eukprot:m.238305 g.238305  ORF g.238305 m.238305 type:complete len:1912 (+) comp17428_c0_seq1:119-5854(+)